MNGFSSCLPVTGGGQGLTGDLEKDGVGWKFADSKSSITPVPGKPTPSSEFCRHQKHAHSMHTYMQAKHS